MKREEATHQSVRDYIAAKEAGDAAAASRIVREVADRFDSRTTDGTEIAELGEAAWSTDLGNQN